MLKFNGIFIYLLFTMTVAQDATLLKHGNSHRNNRINITSAKTEFQYDLKDISNSHDVRLMDDDSKIIDNKHKYITAIDLPTEADNKHHEKLFDFITDDMEILNEYSDSDINKLSDPPDVKYKITSRKLLEPRVVEATTKVKTKLKRNTRGKSVFREKETKHKGKQKERKIEQEYKTTEQQIFDFNLPLSRESTELTARPSHRRKISQILKNHKNLSSVIRQNEIYNSRYKMNSNLDNKNMKDQPNLNLKKPEYHVNFPALYFVKEIGHINRPNGQSLVDAPTTNHKNWINIRRMFDTEHGLKGDSNINKVYKNTIVNKNTDNNAKSSISLVVDPNVTKPQRKEVHVNLKLNSDTINKIFSYPLDTISDAISSYVNKKNKKKDNRRTVSFKNKTIQLSNGSDNENNENETTANSKNIDTRKLKPNLNNHLNANDNKHKENVSMVLLKDTNHDDIKNSSVYKNKTTEKPKNIETIELKLISEIKNDYNVNVGKQFTKRYNVNKTLPLITNIYQSGARKQYNDFDNIYDIQTYINTKKYVQANQIDKTQIEQYPTGAEIYKVTDENHADTKSEEEETLRRFVPKYYKEASGFGARAYIFELQNYKKIKNVPIEVKNTTEMTKQDYIVDKRVTKGIFRFTTRIDRFQFLRQIMNRINF